MILPLFSSITTDWVWLLIFTRFLDHTQRRTTVGRTPLDEWPARRRDLYLTTRNIYNRQISMRTGGIRTHDPSRRAAPDLQLRPRGHWDRLCAGMSTKFSEMPKRDEINGEWRKLRNEKLMKSRRMRWARHVSRVGERRGVYRVLVGKPEGKRPLGRPRRRWENNIKLDLEEVGCVGMD